MAKGGKERDQNSSSEINDRKKLGARLKEAREYLGLPQEEVARFLEIPRTALSHIENGQRRIDALELKNLSLLYKRPVNYFTDDTDSDNNLPEDVAHLARAAKSLSESDRQELKRFADYLRARAKSESSSDG